jgi:hypothetical protein
VKNESDVDESPNLEAEILSYKPRASFTTFEMISASSIASKDCRVLENVNI